MNDLSRPDAGAEITVGLSANPANSQGEAPRTDPECHGASEHALLGSFLDLSSRDREPPYPWGRWSSTCHWRCRACTDRLGYLLTLQVLKALPAVREQAPTLALGTLTLAPPPGLTLPELRKAMELLFGGLDSLWSMKMAMPGHPYAYALVLTADDRELEKRGRAAVVGDSRSAKFNRVRGSDGSWTPPAEALRIHVGRVVRHLARLGSRPSTLKPGYRFGATGCLAPILANALAIVRHEHPCRPPGHSRTTKRPGEISPDRLDDAFRACRWCGLAVPGRAWRHPHCATRRWRAKNALGAVLGPIDLDGLLFRTDSMIGEGLSEPDAMEKAFREFAGRNADLPEGFQEIVTLPKTIVPPGRRPPIELRLPASQSRGRR